MRHPERLAAVDPSFSGPPASSHDRLKHLAVNLQAETLSSAWTTALAASEDNASFEPSPIDTPHLARIDGVGANPQAEVVHEGFLAQQVAALPEGEREPATCETHDEGRARHLRGDRRQWPHRDRRERVRPAGGAFWMTSNEQSAVDSKRRVELDLLVIFIALDQIVEIYDVLFGEVDRGPGQRPRRVVLRAHRTASSMVLA